MDNENAEEFFEKLLGFGPDWGVASIELMDDGSVVELALEHRREGGVECPGCGAVVPLHDHARERKWRHLDMLQYETRIRARIPRCDCPECGVRQIEVPWATPNARFTLLFEAYAIEVLQAARSTTQACDLLRIGWSTADTIMKRGVERGLERREAGELERIGLDEKSFRARHRYITSLCDLDRGRVIEVVEGRTGEKAVELPRCLIMKDTEGGTWRKAGDSSGACVVRWHGSLFRDGSPDVIIPQRYPGCRSPRAVPACSADALFPG